VAQLAVPCDACAQADALGEAAATVARVLERLAEHDAALAALGAGAAGARAASAQSEAALGGAREELAGQGAALRELRAQARTAVPRTLHACLRATRAGYPGGVGHGAGHVWNSVAVVPSPGEAGAQNERLACSAPQSRAAPRGAGSCPHAEQAHPVLLMRASQSLGRD